jgi:glycosyltransferase involved in cell wall biosynthesis
VRLVLATDAWHPQTNGVVRTLSTMVGRLRDAGHTVEVVVPSDFPTVPLPGYREIRLAVWLRGLRARLDAFNPDAVHVATEGPVGLAMRRYCLDRGYAFTTSFHTRFPEYIRERWPVPLAVTYPLIRRFHRPAFRTLVPTASLRADLAGRGFRHMQVWGRGVDTLLFDPARRGDPGLPRPIMLNVGRVAPEKNLEAFLDLPLPGSKVVVGDGPRLAELKRRYPEAVFPGACFGTGLAEWYASADVFVFPSRTDTFGLVMLEAIASGTPVAAYPVTGPRDVLDDGKTGCMDPDLAEAVRRALSLDRERCRAAALALGWDAIAGQFLRALVPIHGDKVPALSEAQWPDRSLVT